MVKIAKIVWNGFLDRVLKHGNKRKYLGVLFSRRPLAHHDIWCVHPVKTESYDCDRDGFYERVRLDVHSLACVTDKMHNLGFVKLGYIFTHTVFDKALPTLGELWYALSGAGMIPTYSWSDKVLPTPEELFHAVSSVGMINLIISLQYKNDFAKITDWYIFDMCGFKYEIFDIKHSINTTEVTYELPDKVRKYVRYRPNYSVRKNRRVLM